MGIYTSFYVVYGVLVKPQDLLGPDRPTRKPVEEPSCTHSEEDRTGKFCSRCGRQNTVRTVEYITDIGNALEEYLNNHPIVQDSKTGRDIGYLIGLRIASMSPDSSGNRKTFVPTPEKLVEAHQKVMDVLAKAPMPIDYPVKPEDLAIHVYMDQR